LRHAPALFLPEHFFKETKSLCPGRGFITTPFDTPAPRSAITIKTGLGSFSSTPTTAVFTPRALSTTGYGGALGDGTFGSGMFGGVVTISGQFDPAGTGARLNAF
jgi:hypothetical protein